jgi:hypothetical protein
VRFDNELERLRNDFILDEEKMKEQEERNKEYTEKMQAKKEFKQLNELPKNIRWFDNQYYLRGCPCFEAIFLACSSYNLDKLWKFTMNSNGVEVDFEI